MLDRSLLQIRPLPELRAAHGERQGRERWSAVVPTRDRADGGSGIAATPARQELEQFRARDEPLSGLEAPGRRPCRQIETLGIGKRARQVVVHVAQRQRDHVGVEPGDAGLEQSPTLCDRIGDHPGIDHLDAIVRQRLAGRRRRAPADRARCRVRGRRPRRAANSPRGVLRHRSGRDRAASRRVRGGVPGPAARAALRGRLPALHPALRDGHRRGGNGRQPHAGRSGRGHGGPRGAGMH